MYINRIIFWHFQVKPLLQDKYCNTSKILYFIKDFRFVSSFLEKNFSYNYEELFYILYYMELFGFLKSEIKQFKFLRTVYKFVFFSTTVKLNEILRFFILGNMFFFKLDNIGDTFVHSILENDEDFVLKFALENLSLYLNEYFFTKHTLDLPFTVIKNFYINIYFPKKYYSKHFNFVKSFLRFQGLNLNNVKIQKRIFNTRFDKKSAEKVQKKLGFYREQ
jgi:hypothetical protein